MQANQFFCLIPKDLVFYLRSFLIIDPGSFKICHDFDNKDGKRSWNNFLCVSCHADWIRLRKEGLSVCLNRFYSNRYLLEEEFRKKVLTMIADPYLQLSLLVEDYEKLTAGMGELLSNSYQIYFRNFSGVSLPVIRHVHNAIFSSCLNLQDCRGLRDVQFLEMLHCDERFHTKLRKECLKSLRTLKISRPVAFPPNIHFPRLIRLGITLDVPFPLDRCSNLEEYILFQLDPSEPEYEIDDDDDEDDEYEDEDDEYGYEEDDDDDDGESEGEEDDKQDKQNDGLEDTNEVFQENNSEHSAEGFQEESEPLNLVSLPFVPAHSASLQLFDVSKASIHLTVFPFHDFSQLKIIRIGNPDNSDCFLMPGMGEQVRQFQSLFFQELCSLQSLIELVFSNAIDPLPSKLLFTSDGKPSKLRSISFPFCKFVKRTFYLTENIRSMDFSESDIVKVIPSNNLNHRYAIASFTKCVNLSPRITSSIFKNCSKVMLDNNSFLSDISALEKVPFLSLDDCTNIKSFSCLGQYQKYLSINGNLSLSNQHLSKLASVRELHISRCPRITDISMLTNNLYLYADNLANLQIAKIYGKDYCLLSLQGYFTSLREIIVYGKIHILRMDHKPSILISTSSKNRITSIELS